jgi:hypothetical protein
MKTKEKVPTNRADPSERKALTTSFGARRLTVRRRGHLRVLYPLRFRIAAPRQKLACDYEGRPQVAKRHGIRAPGLGRPGFFQARGVPFLLTPPRLSKLFCPTVRVLRSWGALAYGGGAGGVRISPNNMQHQHTRLVRCGFCRRSYSWSGDACHHRRPLFVWSTVPAVDPMARVRVVMRKCFAAYPRETRAF